MYPLTRPTSDFLTRRRPRISLSQLPRHRARRLAFTLTTYDQKGWVDLITRVIHPDPGDPVCSVLSSSFYVSNGDDAPTLLSEGVSMGWLTAVSAVFEDAAIQAVTVCIASGDTGAQSKVGDGHAHIQYPASDPWVLAVGGTTIGDISGLSFEEYAWNDLFTFGGFTEKWGERWWDQ